MGNILSKVKGYIRTKVENTKLAIKTKVDNTRNAVYTRVDNTKRAFISRLTHTRDGIYKKVIDTKNGVQSRFNAAADGVFSTVNRIQNGIVTRITNTVTGVRNIKNGVVTRCIQTKDGVVKKCADTRNAVATKYTNTRNSVVLCYTNTRDGISQRYKDSKEFAYKKYRQTREVKLTRYEKFKYSVLFLLFLSLFMLTALTSWDLYYENYQHIHDRNKSIWLVICGMCDCAWYFTKQVFIYAYFGAVVFAEYFWFTTKLVAYYSWEGTKFISWHTWEGFKIATDYMLKGSRIAWQYVSYGSAVAGQYTWHGIGVCWQYMILGATITWEYTVLGSKWGMHYGLEGSKLVAQYTADGTKYAVIHGSIALRNGSIKALQWSYYFLTNFRAASKEAAVYLYESSIYIGGCLQSGSYHGIVMLWDGTQYMAGKTCDGVVLFYHLAINAYCLVCNVLHSGVEKFVYITDTGALAIYNGIIYSIITSYNLIIWFFQTANHYINVSCAFCWMWSNYVVRTASYGVYTGITEYGFVWVCSAGKRIVHWSSVFGAILWKFVTDLFVYVSNCLYTGGVHIYSVLYIICSFIYQIISAISTVIKTSSQSLRYCVTSVFSVIIWCLEETIFAYAFMLNKYNMYREILFTGFIVLLCLYCTGLMRDRKRSLEERNGENSESSSESDEDDIDDATPRLVPRKKDLELPAFSDSGKKKFPSFDDPASDEDTQQADAIKPSEDDLPTTDDEDEFELDQNVPDFMDLSGSESELEPPDPDTTDQDTGSHDLSFEGHLSEASNQEVPDLEFPSELEDDQNGASSLKGEEDASGIHVKNYHDGQNSEQDEQLNHPDLNRDEHDDTLCPDEADQEDGGEVS
ncbi:hypothetical protein LSH36_71g06006 [Paralvinella palmiformis]|uniref:Uncharacterized protein n=1 Tax=Paralvinella palmiformis TaxID=53620 RepID=A0AAD9K425_9ANNE|nr:hypothetical protein LSH36_71g06006 [Paralvinella palmiformis]